VNNGKRGAWDKKGWEPLN